MMHYCSNGRLLLISDQESFNKDLSSNLVPNVVLLTVWTYDEQKIPSWENLIKQLLKKGTKNFVCIGNFSEQLHDEIDDILCQEDSDEMLNVITTYHIDESIEDAINYYVYGTEIMDKERGCLLAILDKNDKQDQEVRFLLEKI